MVRAALQHTCDIAQLHRTIAKRLNVLQTQSTLQEVHWRGMNTWLEEKDRKRVAYHQDDLLWGKGITDMVATVVAATERDRREERKGDTEGVGPEASINLDLTQTGGAKKAEEHQQPQPGRQLKSMAKSNPNPTPNPRPAPTPKPTPTPRATLTPKGVMTSVPTYTR